MAGVFSYETRPVSVASATSRNPVGKRSTVVRLTAADIRTLAGAPDDATVDAILENGTLSSDEGADILYVKWGER